MLAWTEATDDVAVYAYDLYRSTDGETFTKIHRELAPGLTYRDEAVERGLLYYYYVVAIDTSFNRSQPSNTVSHVAEPKMVAVTFDVTVPSFTPGIVYLTRVVNDDGTVGEAADGEVDSDEVQPDKSKHANKAAISAGVGAMACLPSFTLPNLALS